MAAYTSTVYRLDSAGEVYEVSAGEVHDVAVEEADAKLEPAGAPAVAMAASCTDESFDVNAWWSKQLGGALKRALTHH